MSVRVCFQPCGERDVPPGHGRSGEWRDGTDIGRNQDDQKKCGLSGSRDNDVSGDQGPYSEETEEYRKLLGRINCALAGEADEVYEVICGEPVMVKKKKRKIQKWKREERIDLWIVREGSGFL